MLSEKFEEEGSAEVTHHHKIGRAKGRLAKVLLVYLNSRRYPRLEYTYYVLVAFPTVDLCSRLSMSLFNSNINRNLPDSCLIILYTPS